MGKRTRANQTTEEALGTSEVQTNAIFNLEQKYYY